MKKQISRLSPHQNGKVFGVLMAVTSLVFILPMFLIASLTAPPVDEFGHDAMFPRFFLIVMPLVYFVFGYLSVVIGCAIYNALFKYIGGFEFEVKDKGAE
jgi:hypothetical protein